MRVLLTWVITVVTLAFLTTIAGASSCSELAAKYAGRDTTGSGAFNVGCCYSLAGKTDSAFDWLHIAVRKGYHDSNWLRADTDLYGLHDDPRWPGVVETCEESERAYLASINVELYKMFQADQAERSGNGTPWDLIAQNDSLRRVRVQEMIADSTLIVRDDFIHAAFIFQHGVKPDDYALAHELALRAVALDSTSELARWIAAASKDRHLVSLGEPQWYGTQFNLRDGRWTIDPIDTVNITDDDRAYWSVPPLEKARLREREMNSDE